MRYSMSLVAVLAIAGCGGAQEMEDQETEAEASLADGEGKEDSLASTSTYYTLERDFRKCAYPMCGGYYVSRVNRAKTICADGSSRERCYVAQLDQSGLQVESAGEATIVRGKINSKKINGSHWGVFKASEAWKAATDAAPTGFFYRIKDSGIQCIQAPCPGYHRAKLNSTVSGNFNDLDLDNGGASAAQLDEAMNAVYDTSILVAGSLSNRKITASQFYTRTDKAVVCAPVTCKLGCPDGWAKNAAGCDICDCAPPPPKTCHVGGCSSEICSDNDSVFSICIFKPEFACYHAATCEQQADGNCGWTQDAALLACLAPFAP